MKVIVTNVFGPLNLGDFELFSELLNNLKRAGAKDISAIAREPELCREAFKGVEFFEQFGKADNKLLRLLYLIVALIGVFTLVPARLILPKKQYLGLLSLRDSDIVFGCPGGFLEDSSFSFYTHLVQLYLARKLSKRVVLSPMSIGPTNSKVNAYFLNFVLNGVDVIFVREMFSKKLCDSMALQSTLSNDLAFEKFNHNICRREGRSNETLYVTVINWNFPDCSNVSERFENYLDSLVSVSATLSKKYDLKVKVIEQVSSDLPAINLFRKRMLEMDVKTEVLGNNMSPSDIMDEITNAKLVIASRFHSAIFSLNVGVPVIAISYLPKTTGMLTLYNADDLFFEINELSFSKLLERSESFITDESSYYNSRAKLSDGILKLSTPFTDFVNENVRGV